MKVYWLEQTAADVPVENDWLSANETVCLNAMRFLKRRADWRLGRWTAKCALSIHLDVPAHAQVFQKMEIRAAPSGAPEAFFGNQRSAVSLSLSHRDGIAICAVSKSGVEMGCDLETVEPRSGAFIADYFTLEEQALVAGTSAADRDRLLALLWSAKESALKALHAGLRLDTRSVIVDPLGESFDLHGWTPLWVRFTGDRSTAEQVFHGWWQQADNIVRTVVANPPPDPPIPVYISAHFFDSASHWKPVAC
jgi:4'-phosphopantetheinyl transferase